MDGDRWFWNREAHQGRRSAEIALSQARINLFWTTQKTIMEFEGSSRWIARSLVLFSEGQEKTMIETHPHGAFTFLCRMLRSKEALPSKRSKEGRKVRLDLLQSFIPELRDDMVPNYDAMDAVCSSLVAGLHKLGLTKAYGDPTEGGQIWLPDTEVLQTFVF